MWEAKLYLLFGSFHSYLTNFIMSRIANHPIEIPEKTEVTIDGGTITVSGPKGELTREYNQTYVEIDITDDGIEFSPANNSRQSQALWGTYASHVKNMIVGVNDGYEKKLTFKGIGYGAEVQGDTLKLDLGFSHPIEFDIPEGLDVSVKKNEITISGIDKEAVGQFAAEIRDQRKPEPYKGKGIRYSDEKIRRKEGKKTV